jgi:SAM-dependent methyltransferase
MQFSENISEKRIHSKNAIRSKVHNLMYESVLAALDTNRSVVDVGCGDGALVLRIPNNGQIILGIDVSPGNIRMANSKLEKKTTKYPKFSVADATETQLADQKFEQSISHHVLEHLASFDDGLIELKRITKSKIIIAIPTAWSPMSWTLLGGGTYWIHGRTGILRLFYGLLRTINAFLLRKVGVDEGSYSSLEAVPHIFFFPKRILRRLECEDWKVTESRAQVTGIPWMLRSIKLGTKANSEFGLGTLFVLERKAK